jgi:hypothetical protein
MEPILGVLGGLGAAGIFYLLQLVGAAVFVKKYGSIVEKVFSVIDPVAGQLITGYNGSEVQQAVELAVARVADSKLDQRDVAAIANYVLGKFDPKLAAVKAIDENSPEGQASLELVKSVGELRDGVTFDEVLAIAKNAKALI